MQNITAAKKILKINKIQQEVQLQWTPSIYKLKSRISV